MSFEYLGTFANCFRNMPSYNKRGAEQLTSTAKTDLLEYSRLEVEQLLYAKEIDPYTLIPRLYIHRDTANSQNDFRDTSLDTSDFTSMVWTSSQHFETQKSKRFGVKLSQYDTAVDINFILQGCNRADTSTAMPTVNWQTVKTISFASAEATALKTEVFLSNNKYYRLKVQISSSTMSTALVFNSFLSDNTLDFYVESRVRYHFLIDRSMEADDWYDKMANRELLMFNYTWKNFVYPIGNTAEVVSTAESRLSDTKKDKAFLGVDAFEIVNLVATGVMF